MINKELYTTGFYNDSNLVSYWRFEGNSNDSKGSNNGTDTSITYGTSYGKFGQGASFNGSSSYISLGTANPFSTGILSVNVWLYIPSGVGQNTYILIKGNDASTNNIGCYLGSSNTTDVGFKILYGFATWTCDSGWIEGLRDKWIMVTWVANTNKQYIFINGKLIANSSVNTVTPTASHTLTIGAQIRSGYYYYYNGYMDDLALFNRALSPSEVYNLYNADKSKYHAGKTSDYGSLPCGDDGTISLDTCARFQRLLERSVEAGKLSTNDIVSTYSLVYTTSYSYVGACLSVNGDIHLIPHCASVGQKISNDGTVSTYALIYTTTYSYSGGVLNSNGEIHFVPYDAQFGQKISIDGTVLTYSLVYSTDNAYIGGVLSPNGDIHFVPSAATVGQKVSVLGEVSTYSLVYTNNDAYIGGVLAPNGDIHFAPSNATVGQKISSTGVVSTYSLVHTGCQYSGGVLASNGDVHFVPYISKYTYTEIITPQANRDFSGANNWTNINFPTWNTVGDLSVASGAALYREGTLGATYAPFTSGKRYRIRLTASNIVGGFELWNAANTKYLMGFTTSGTKEVTVTWGSETGGLRIKSIATYSSGDFDDFSACEINSLSLVGQKVSSAGVVSTYSLIYTNDYCYYGGVLAPNGDIHFVPQDAEVGQKISMDGIVSTYSLVYTTPTAYTSGIMVPNGDIYFVPCQAPVGQKISTQSTLPFSLGVCCSPFFNKF